MFVVSLMRARARATKSFRIVILRNELFQRHRHRRTAICYSYISEARILMHALYTYILSCVTCFDSSRT